MFGSEILEVVIGLSFFYLLASLIVSAINEAISNLFSLRAKTLQTGIKEMFSDEKLRDKIYAHPLIQSFCKGEKRPSYISSSAFARALLDIVLPENQEKDFQLSPNVKRSIDNVEFLNSNTKWVLKGFIDEQSQNITQVRKNIEIWYDNSMDRVSGWYKRKTQLIMSVIAVIVCFLFNLDTIMYAKLLFYNKEVRAVVVTAAQEHIRRIENDTSKTSSEINAALKSELLKLDLPLGWGQKPDSNSVYDKLYANPSLRDFNVNEWLLKLAGILCTVFAICLGAPFWFDTLSKFINLRGAGKKPETAQPSN